MCFRILFLTVLLSILTILPPRFHEVFLLLQSKYFKLLVQFLKISILKVAAQITLVLGCLFIDVYANTGQVRCRFSKVLLP